MAEPSVQDLAYRTAASVFGGPVDLATMVMRPFGYKTPDEKVFGSSEYIGKKLEDVGLVSSARAPITEFLTSLATPAGLAKGAALTAPKVLSMFVGARSLTWDASAAEKAKMLADIGTDARTIWQQTGTWKGPDGKWRQEIDDSALLFNPSGDPGMRRSTGIPFAGSPDYNYGPALGGSNALMEHPLLEKAYGSVVPNTFVRDGGNGVLGEFDPGKQAITMYAPATGAQARSTAIHELQHVIQEREGFSQGGNYEMFNQQKDAELARDALHWARDLRRILSTQPGMDPMAAEKKAIQEYQQLGAMEFVPSREARDLAREPGVLFDSPNAYQSASDLEALSKMYGLDRRTTPYTAREAYRRLAGEAEARATQARMNMTPAERRAAFPEESYDVPINQIIVR